MLITYFVGGGGTVLRHISLNTNVRAKKISLLRREKLIRAVSFLLTVYLSSRSRRSSIQNKSKRGKITADHIKWESLSVACLVVNFNCKFSKELRYDHNLYPCKFAAT